jgi:hypothetical protein
MLKAYEKTQELLFIQGPGRKSRSHALPLPLSTHFLISLKAIGKVQLIQLKRFPTFHIFFNSCILLQTTARLNSPKISFSLIIALPPVNL